jgi:sensor histidine kinase YesM
MRTTICRLLSLAALLLLLTGCSISQPSFVSDPALPFDPALPSQTDYQVQSGYPDHPQQPSVKNGVINLAQWNFGKGGNVRLDGTWEFYRDQLIGPGHFTDAGVNLTGFYEAPRYWTKYKDLSLPALGVATYRAVIETDNAAEILSIKVPEIYTEYALWVNGELLESNGSFRNDEPRYLRPDVYTFYKQNTRIEIVLQVRNSLHRHAGIGQSFMLGTPAQINSERARSTAVDQILFSIGFAAGLYHFSLFFFRKKDKSLLCFALFCTALSVRTIISDEDWITQLIPKLPFAAGSRILSATIPICIISLMTYIWLIQKKNTPPGLPLKILLGISGLFLLIILTAPVIFYSTYAFVYLIIASFSCIWILYRTVEITITRKNERVVSLFGIAFLIIGAFNDMFNFNQILNTGFNLSMGLAVFVVAQSVLLARQYSKAHAVVEELSVSLKQSLEKVDSAETAFLQAQIKPHFLYNALNTIAECCETDPQEAGRLILSLSKYFRGTLDFENLGGLIGLKKELELVKAYAAIEKARFEEIRVEFDLCGTLPPVQLPPLTLQPLVENAIKHGLRKKAGGGVVQVRILQEGDKVLFFVEDNGTGIPGDKLAMLLNVPSEGGSIGLYNIHARLVRLYGKGLTIESIFGAGTKVSFEIPCGGGTAC